MKKMKKKKANERIIIRIQMYLNLYKIGYIKESKEKKIKKKQKRIKKILDSMELEKETNYFLMTYIDSMTNFSKCMNCCAFNIYD